MQRVVPDELLCSNRAAFSAMQFSCNFHVQSTLGRSTRIFDLLAKCPVTPPDLGVALSREKAILGLRLLSPEVPSTEDLVVSGLPATVSLGPFVEFLVGARHPERWRDPREVAALNRCLAAHVKVEADVCGVRGDTRPQALIIPQDASTPGVKVVVFRRGTSSDAPIVVSRVFFAGLPVASPELPTPGEVWAAANAGDAPRLITALEDGGSADEATEVRNHVCAWEVMAIPFRKSPSSCYHARLVDMLAGWDHRTRRSRSWRPPRDRESSSEERRCRSSRSRGYQCTSSVYANAPSHPTLALCRALRMRFITRQS